MTTISLSRKLVTLINVFTVEPDNQQQLLELLARATETSVRHAAGLTRQLRAGRSPLSCRSRLAGEGSGPVVWAHPARARGALDSARFGENFRRFHGSSCCVAKPLRPHALTSERRFTRLTRLAAVIGARPPGHRTVASLCRLCRCTFSSAAPFVDASIGVKYKGETHGQVSY